MKAHADRDAVLILRSNEQQRRIIHIFSSIRSLSIDLSSIIYLV